jgi:TolA-binding protein
VTEPSEPKVVSTLVTLLRNSVTGPTPAQVDRGLDTLERRIENRSWPRFVGRALAVALLVGAVVAAVLSLGDRGGSRSATREVALAQVEGGQLLDGGYLSEAGHAGMKLVFSEGTRFALEPGTRGRLRNLSPTGATLALDRGAARFAITPNPAHRWSVEAGPFVVSVKGTEFSVAWDPTGEKLEISVWRGRVAVTGPFLSDNLELRPGQKLNVDLPRRESVLSQPVPSAEPGPSATPQSPGAPSSAETPAPPPPVVPRAAPSASSAAERRWSEAMARGDWDSILADVEQDGLEKTLRSATSRDLFALADAARYRRRTDWARAALMAQRERFPSSTRSVDAAFLLGRVEEATGSGRRQAVAWYDSYLSRAPNGSYAAEALGRKMILIKELEGALQARPIAEEYLRRFPNGSHAAAARALSQG